MNPIGLNASANLVQAGLWPLFRPGWMDARLNKALSYCLRHPVAKGSPVKTEGMATG